MNTSLPDRQIGPTPADVRAARMAAGLTQRACADRFGYTLTGWQKKENSSGASMRSLSRGEYELLLLLAGQHPDFRLVSQDKDQEPAAQITI